jgi:hypothetical protein
MRRFFVLLGALVALGLVACGGQEIQADEIPGSPPDLPLPAGSEALGGEAQGATATPTPTPEATATPTPEAGGASATPEPATGESATAAAEDGGEAAQYEEFCAQNPGAC